MITERVDAITKIPTACRSETPPAPRSVKIELTGRCNYRCAFCAHVQHLRQEGDMDRHVFERLALEMRSSGVEELGLFYLGESLLCPWLTKAISFAKHEAGYPYVFLTTNGSMASPRRLEPCFRAGLDSLKFSFNYADEVQFRGIARVDAQHFRNAIENIKAAKESRDLVEAETGHRCGLYASYIAYDGEQGERMKEAIEEIHPFVDQVYALPLYNQASLVSEQEMALGWVPSPGNRGRLDAMRDPLPCWALFTEGHVTWDAKLAACCFSHTDDFEMGDLTRMSFMEAWHSKSFRALRRANLEKNVAGTACERCVAA